MIQPKSRRPTGARRITRPRTSGTCRLDYPHPFADVFARLQLAWWLEGQGRGQEAADTVRPCLDPVLGLTHYQPALAAVLARNSAQKVT